MITLVNRHALQKTKTTPSSTTLGIDLPSDSSSRTWEEGIIGSLRFIYNTVDKAAIQCLVSSTRTIESFGESQSFLVYQQRVGQMTT